MGTVPEMAAETETKVSSYEVKHEEAREKNVETTEEAENENKNKSGRKAEDVKRFELKEGDDVPAALSCGADDYFVMECGGSGAKFSRVDTE